MGKMTGCEFLALMQYKEGQNNNYVHTLIQEAHLVCLTLRESDIQIYHH